ncbi:TetR/AcrR family transcriptional regulator [Arvimicrobium flavum]|uniref:TetR/AcrR family transcriptional regulator n=1 Tax=Arvimicrobium flavum TaxID=3393320 RepID=UPI00237BEB68|nr:TetR/AcrR family transcriptional regulator [Mesorhizobium shangrilense]
MTKTARTRVERSRRSIVQAASDLFLKHGFAGTSMDEVAATAGVSKQTVYAHYASKESLFLEVVAGMTGGAADTMQERVEDPDGERPVEEFLLEYAEQQLAIVMTPRLMQLRRLVIAEAGRFPELGKALHTRGPQHAIDRLTRAFELYRQRSAVAVEDARVAASFFNWLVMGAPVNDAMLLGDDAIPSPDALRGHARECVRIFLAAYGK